MAAATAYYYSINLRLPLAVHTAHSKGPVGGLPTKGNGANRYEERDCLRSQDDDEHTGRVSGCARALAGATRKDNGEKCT